MTGEQVTRMSHEPCGQSRLDVRMRFVLYSGQSETPEQGLGCSHLPFKRKLIALKGNGKVWGILADDHNDRLASKLIV